MLPTDQIRDCIVIDPEKVARYRDMLRCGDRPPAIVVMRNGDDGWKVRDGCHRLAAAKAEGQQTIACIDCTYPSAFAPFKYRRVFEVDQWRAR